MSDALADRKHHGREPRPQRQQDADHEVLAGDEQDNREGDEQAIEDGSDGVADEPALLARRRLGRPQLAHAETVAFDEVAEIPGAARTEIRNLDQVGEHVVAVVAQQRIAVEDDGRHAGDQHHVIGNGADQTGLGVEPHQHRERRQQQLGHHAGRADEEALPLVAECRRCRGIDIRNRQEHEEHHAHLVHFTATGTHRAGVSEFVKRLDQRKDDGHHQQVVGGEHAVGQTPGELAPVLTGSDAGRADDDEPRDHTPAIEQRRVQRVGRAQQAIRIEQRQLDRHRIAQVAPPLAGGLLVVAPQQLVDVWRHLALQQVGAVQLAQQADRFFLRGRIVAEPVARQIPGLLHGTLAIEQADQAPRGGIEAIQASRRTILQYVPELAAIVVPMDLGVALQAWPQPGNAVPRRAV